MALASSWLTTLCRLLPLYLRELDEGRSKTQPAFRVLRQHGGLMRLDADQALGTIVTTNLPFGKYNQIFANDAVAHAIVDRITADAEVFFLQGDSYRAKEKKDKKSKIEKNN